MTIKKLLNEIKGDLGKKHGFIVFLKAFYFNPSFRVLLNHRIGKYCYQSKFKILHLVASRLRYKMISKRGCEISYNSILGKNIRLAHPIGIVIGDKTVIEDNVTIFQYVTFGSHGRKGVEFNYPIVKKGAKIFVGAKLIGGIIIGQNAVIGANAVVNINVPEKATAVGIPCKIINK
ncbi:MAG: hypothetical protein M9897_04995 [Brumimicrobium sp.]|nr:hypothetical protein [Brumimicrobium sp.]